MNQEHTSTLYTILWVTLAVTARIITDKVTKMSEILGKLVVAAFVAIIVQNIVIHYNVPHGIQAPIIGICSYIASDLALFVKVTWQDYSKSIGLLLHKKLIKILGLEEVEKELDSETKASSISEENTNVDKKE